MDRKIEAEERRLFELGGDMEAGEEYWDDHTALNVDCQLQRIADDSLKSRRQQKGVAAAVEMREVRKSAIEVLHAAFQGNTVRLECLRCHMVMPGNARGAMIGRF